MPQAVNIPLAPMITPNASPASNLVVTAPAREPKAEEPHSESEESKQIALEEFPERQSPGRYIRGAPLHNVIEEEEEQD
ncbi:hypothetical protein AX14_010801 [Amanita brunnescens Koide BX004]|nr:hypothetical protein AX14_010801 [Amanita brunnescens Koide BX004]